MKRYWYVIFLIPVVLIAQTQINWQTQVKNKPSLWNDPGSGTFLKRTGAFTWSAATANSDYFGDPGSNGILKRTAPFTLGIAAPGTDLWNDPGSGTFLKRTGAYTFAAAIPGTDYWNDPGSGTILKRTGTFTFAAASAGTDYMGIATPLNFNQTPLTNKGDLWVTDGSANHRLPGSATDGYNLIYDSTQTNGLRWGCVTCINSRATNSANQLTASGTPFTLSFDTNTFDNGGVHSTVTNKTRFTPGVAGTYRILGQVSWLGNTTGTYRGIYIQKNGTTVLGQTWGNNPTFFTIPTRQQVSAISVLGATDYIEFIVQQDGGSLTVSSGDAETFGSIIREY